jgi:Outer membrane protein beta-barrel domain
MKKIFSIALLLMALCNCDAQTRIAIKGGLTYSSARVTDNEVNRSTSYKPGISLGVQFRVPFDGILNFAPYAAYNMRSFKTVYPTKTVENTIHYLDLVPALALYFPTDNDDKIALSFGPVFGFTNFGSEKVTVGTTTTTSKMKFGYGDYGWFDLGVTAGLGYHKPKYFAEVVYYHGLANINNYEDAGPLTIQNRMFGINFGYYFK